jgi:hypothetical protein
MRPLMLLLLSVPLLIGVLALVAAQTSARELLLPPQAQWTWVHKVRAAGFASDCEHALRGGSANVTRDVLADGQVRLICHNSGVQYLPEVG